MRGPSVAGLIGLGWITYITAECPNACSGHGDCGAFDMCTCWRNWMAADCSQRICPYGSAHVDSPKGNLDGSISGLNAQSSLVKQYDVLGTILGTTTEMYPQMQDSLGNKLINTAHAYAECSNKGTCDRKKGLCTCLPGYEGHACQRASCPNACSGYGTCHTIEQIAHRDYGNTYQLWDRQSTMGCLCDYGYTGPDCSLRQCPMGMDPLYTNGYATAGIASFSYTINDASAVGSISGTYAIKFYDAFGEEHITAPLLQQGSSNYCSSIISALEKLPNYAVPPGKTLCSFATVSSAGTAIGVKYTLKFEGNPGYLRPIQIINTLDGLRPTLISSSNGAPETTYVTSAGSTGEFADIVPTYCAGITVNITNNAGSTLSHEYVATLTPSNAAMFQRCLGSADTNPANNVGTANWDLGGTSPIPSTDLTAGRIGLNPHLIKLVKINPTDIYDSGRYYILWSDGTNYYLLSRQPSTDLPTQAYYVFTTDGIVSKVSFDWNDNGLYTDVVDGPVVARWTPYTNVIYTNIDASCNNGAQINDCIKKGDYLFLPAGGYLNDRTGFAFPPASKSSAPMNYQNIDYSGMMYRVTRVWNTSSDATQMAFAPYTEDRYRIQLDQNINWDGSALGRPWGDTVYSQPVGAMYQTGAGLRTGYQQLFKFTPNTAVTYVSECAGRGTCDRTLGLCQCFKGYTNYNCDTQSALAM